MSLLSDVIEKQIYCELNCIGQYKREVIIVSSVLYHHIFIDFISVFSLQTYGLQIELTKVSHNLFQGGKLSPLIFTEIYNATA